MAEGEAAHRRDMERKQLEADVALRESLTSIEGDRIKSIFSSDRLGQILGATISAIALLSAGGTAIAGLLYGINSQWYWAIPVACVSLPVLGMVKAIRSKPTQAKVDTETAGNGN